MVYMLTLGVMVNVTIYIYIAYMDPMGIYIYIYNI